MGEGEKRKEVSLLQLSPFFASIFPLSPETPDTQVTKIPYILTRSFFAFLPAETEFEIMSLPNNKSHGLYFCPTFLLNCARKAISSPLAEK